VLGVFAALVEGLALLDLEQRFLAVLQRVKNGIGVSFTNVDQEELRLVFVGLIELFQVARLATEGRSGVAAENQHHRLFVPEAGEGDFVFPLQIRQGKIGSGVAHS
jgi:hypothetical protein